MVVIVVVGRGRSRGPGQPLPKSSLRNQRKNCFETLAVASFYDFILRNPEAQDLNTSTLLVPKPVISETPTPNTPNSQTRTPPAQEPFSQAAGSSWQSLQYAHDWPRCFTWGFQGISPKALRLQLVGFGVSTRLRVREFGCVLRDSWADACIGFRACWVACTSLFGDY